MDICGRRGWMEETLSQMDVATMYIYLVDERVTKSWAEVLRKLKGIFGPDFKVVDEGYAHFDLSLLLIAWELQYVRKNFPEEQKKEIEKSILQIIGEWDNGDYSLAEVNDYMQLDSKDMSSRLLYRLIRDEKKFAVYKISEIDLRRTWEIIKPLTGVASLAMDMNSNDLLASISDSYYSSEALKMAQNDPEYQALSKKLQELKAQLPRKRTLASLKKLSLDSSGIPTPLTTRQQIKLKPREPRPIIYQRENMNLPVESVQSQRILPKKAERLTWDNREVMTERQQPFQCVRGRELLKLAQGIIPDEVVDTSITKSKLNVKTENVKHKDSPAECSTTKRNEGLRRGEWMKNWKVPAIMLPLLFFGFYLVVTFNKSWGITRDMLDIFAVLWLVIMLATVIWLLIVLPWKGMKIRFMNHVLMRNWKVPGIILVLLIVAMSFRWSTISSQTTSSAVLKHVQDNWNGAVYEQRYPTKGGYDEKIVRYPTLIPISSQELTPIWGLCLTGSILWLLIAVSKTRKVDNDKEYDLVNKEQKGSL